MSPVLHIFCHQKIIKNKSFQTFFIPRAPMAMVATIVISAVGLLTICQPLPYPKPCSIRCIPLQLKGVTVVPERGASVKAMVVEKCVFLGGGCLKGWSETRLFWSSNRFGSCIKIWVKHDCQYKRSMEFQQFLGGMVQNEITLGSF